MLQNEIQHLPIGEWRQMTNAESEDEREGKTVTGKRHIWDRYGCGVCSLCGAWPSTQPILPFPAFGTDRYSTSQPLGVITAFDCIDYLDAQPKMQYVKLPQHHQHNPTISNITSRE
jgi:hypothetical protein